MVKVKFKFIADEDSASTPGDGTYYVRDIAPMRAGAVIMKLLKTSCKTFWLL